MAAGTSFENDLRLAREARHLTLDQVQQETRVPVDVLRRFEDGHLAGDPTFNEVYLRAFLRTYARAVGLPQSDVLAAYDRAKGGTYRGELRPGYVPSAEPEPSVPPPASEEPPPVGDGLAAASPGARAAGIARSPLPAAPVSAAARPLADAPTPDAVLGQPLAPGPRPIVVPTRVTRAGVRGARRSYDKNWTTILLLFGIVVAALIAALYLLVFRDADPPEAGTPDAAVPVAAGGAAAGAAAGGPQLQRPFRVVVAARGNGLQSFSVSRDGDRAAYWINTGESQTFEADSSLVLWGEGTGGLFADAAIEWQGQRWTPADGRPITLDGATGQRLLDSLAAAAPPTP